MHLGFHKGTRDLYTIEPEHLRTHAMCVGMTGSGKTGLCIALLEELALAKVPVVMIDPKGDLGNIMFAPRTPEEYGHLIPREESSASGMDHASYAARVCDEWQRAQLQDAVSTEKVSAYCDTWIRQYTPGGGPGLGLSILSAMRAPRDRADMAQRAEIVADTLLSMVKRTEQTQQTRALVASLMLHAWEQGADASLHELVDWIADPPMAHLGGLDVETFYPRARRMRLAQEFNAVLASPMWEAWLTGSPLDFGSLLYKSDGTPTVTVISIAHLGDVQRQFFVALLLNQAIQWMREQPGTTGLRALLYMDEVAGYFPPNGNPPAKRAALTLIKQARAFGLGLMFASQNPVDVDYKLLGNMGLWMVGKLNTERDKRRLEEGLEGQVRVPTLGKREFLVRNIHQKGDPVVIRSRCTISYLFGPMSAEQMAALVADVPRSTGDAMQQRRQRLEIAIGKQAQVVAALQREVTYATGGDFLTMAVGVLFGRRGSALRQLTRQPPKKAQQLLEARARLRAMERELQELAVLS